MTSYAGIDPGLSGAIAVIEEIESYRKDVYSPRIHFLDMPTLEVLGGTKRKREYDMGHIADFLKPFRSVYGFSVALERQQAMPAKLHGRTQGVVSTFQTGVGFGMLQGLLFGLGIPFELVHPVSWKKAMMPNMGQDKAASIVVAQRMFPQVATDLRRKKDHARADALLICEFVRRRRASVESVR